ncbi:MAG: tRNA 2-thiouridine(34) synthase MnmA [Phycisphaerales bacterium]|nr:tRNA 2-thiouridine(34) synthase MnmA [Phycisphaerales bacterium]
MAGSKGKVLVAMSGGVDSSVAAGLLVRAGYEVVGCFMRLGSPGETLDSLVPAEEACAIGGGGDEKQIKIGHQGCCSINDAADARLVAAELGIPFYVCNFKKDFGRIIDYFVDEYASGRTPNPCVRCNDWLKFGKLHEYASQIGAGCVASGHYARVVDHGPAAQPHRGTGFRLMRGVDHSKDQSYVLFGVPRAQLGHMMLPIGGMEKTRVREIAREMGLPVFDKPDSQEICFVPDNDYAGLVERKRKELASEGDVVDAAGRKVGTHGGQHRFTIGQRRGVSVALGYPVYVIGKDAGTNTVTVGPKEMLLAESCIAWEANWLVDGFDGWRRVWAKYRYNTPAVEAEVRVVADVGGDGGGTPSGRTGAFEVRFDRPQSAVAGGQAVVLYDAEEPDVVLGGGWIRSVERHVLERA